MNKEQSSKVAEAELDLNNALVNADIGPVAYAIGLIGIAIAGGAMLWGGELTEFGRRACMIGLVVSVLVFAAPMLSSAFGVNAAVI
jgi:type IV secretory pathway VirB2 component (pilin)